MVALSVRERGEGDGDPAREVDAHRGVVVRGTGEPAGAAGRPERRGLDERRDADAEQPAGRSRGGLAFEEVLVSDHFECAFERGTPAAGLVLLTEHGPPGAVGDHVATSELHPVDAERAGCVVEQHLAQRLAGGHADAAERRQRRLVADDAAGVVRVRVEVVEPRHGEGGDHELDVGADPARVRAGVGGEPRAHRSEPPVVIESSFEFGVRLFAVRARCQRLAAVLDPAYGHSQPDRGHRGAQVLGEHHLLATERAAHRRADDADVADRQPERVGERGAREMGHLRRQVAGELSARRVVVGDDPARLERGGDDALDREPSADRVRRPRERRVDVSVGRRLAKVVAAGDVVVNRVVIGERLELEDHRVGAVLRGVAIIGDDRGHRLADVADAITGQRDPRCLERALELDEVLGRVHMGEVGVGEHRADAGDVACGAEVDRHDAGVRRRRADERQLEHPWQLHVGHVAGGTGQHRGILEPLHAFAGPPPLGVECELAHRRLASTTASTIVS